MKKQFFDKHTIAPEVEPELFEYPTYLEIESEVIISINHILTAKKRYTICSSGLLNSWRIS
jgi:hypothetical protein